MPSKARDEITDPFLNFNANIRNLLELDNNTL